MKKILDTRKPKLIYVWNKRTSVYSGIGEADPDPNDVTNWLIPSNATTIEIPKEKEGYSITWNGEKWVSKKD